jgi:amino acid transporter
MATAEMDERTQQSSLKAPPSSKQVTDVEIGSIHQLPPAQHLQRKLHSKEVQLFAIGGAIGTSLFVQMGSALPKGGPAGLFIGFVIWGAVMLCINECFGMQHALEPYRLGGPLTKYSGVSLLRPNPITVHSPCRCLCR